ncbi:RICIN domain-containing protein [Kribbella sp. NPDC003505]|uniref:RICIN domain-containing protein n=1 Tax=Kribbella sp. NPDC003505 TaxID=3154448 RepID=UPI0033B6E636
MRNAETFQYLTVGNASHVDGAPAIQWTSLSGLERRWEMRKIHDVPGDSWDEWIIHKKHSHDCLAIPESSTGPDPGSWTRLPQQLLG